jgi:hypothetical protein
MDDGTRAGSSVLWKRFYHTCVCAAVSAVSVQSALYLLCCCLLSVCDCASSVSAFTDEHNFEFL